jgi:hypothetical protein
MREELESRVLQVKKALFYFKTVAKAAERAITSNDTVAGNNDR